MQTLYLVHATADGQPIVLHIGVDAESSAFAETMLDDYLEHDAPGELGVRELIVDDIAVMPEPFTILTQHLAPNTQPEPPPVYPQDAMENGKCWCENCGSFAADPSGYCSYCGR